MSTRSRIGIPTKSGVKSIYCHFDGYPEGVGETLSKHWTSIDKVNALIALGDLSVLGEEIGEKHPFHADFGTTQTESERKMCLAYGRDRGEEGCEAKEHPKDAWPDSDQEFEYLALPSLKTGEITWQVREISYGAGASAWKPITK